MVKYKSCFLTNSFLVEFWERQCKDVFGSKFDLKLLQRGIDRSNWMYGAKEINVTNVVFVQGSIDPWHAMGVTQDLNEDAKAIYISGTAHCANMYPAQPDDLPQLAQARKTIQDTIAKWLK